AATDPAMQERTEAIKALRYLGTGAAVNELARRLSASAHSLDDLEFLLGLLGSPGDASMAELRLLLQDPDYAVSRDFSQGFIALMRDPDQPLEKLKADDRKNTETLQRNLCDSLSRKRGNALAATVNTILRIQADENAALPAMGDAAIAKLASVFDRLPI